jgi:hypothetical protein
MQRLRLVIVILGVGWCISCGSGEPQPATANASADRPPSAAPAASPGSPAQPAKPPEVDQVLPGLTSGGLTTALQSRGLTCDGPRQEQTISSWRCTGDGVVLEFMGSPTRIEYVTASTDASTARGRQFLVFVATTPYDGSEPDKARDWASRNVTRDFVETRIGDVLLRISGPSRLRSLSLMRPNSAWAK